MKTSTLKILLAVILFICGYTIQAQNIFQAIQDGQFEKVEQLLNENPGWVDSTIYGGTPLMLASLFKNEKIVELLIKHGVDMYKVEPTSGMSALHMAARRNNLAVVDVFIRNGMDMNAKIGNNNSVLSYAIESNNKELLDLLIRKNIKLPEEKELRDQLFHAAVKLGFQDFADTLMKKGASLSGTDNFGRSLLHNAVIGKNVKWIYLLITKKVDLNKPDNFGRTPLHYAVELEQADIAKALMKNGATVNVIDSAHFTPLNIAQESGFIEIADFLKSKGGILSKPAIVNIRSDKEKASEIKVTYIANMGVLISSASKNILIDVLFDKAIDSYPGPSPHIMSKINNLEAPLNSIDLVLVTHSDGDHFSAPMIAEYLSKNKSVKVVCSNLTASEFKKGGGYHLDTSRIVAITPELYNSIDTIVNAISIKILRLRHSGRDGTEENIGFVVDMDGINVFHSGDAGGKVSPDQAVSDIMEYDSIAIAKMNIDVAILNRGFLRNSNSPGLQIIEQYMKPSYIFLTHFSDNNKDGEWDPVDQTIKSNKAMLPHITLFKFPMQSIIIRK